MGFYDTEAFIATRPHEQKTAYPRLDFVESGFRYYSPELGRWTRRDPALERAGTASLLIAQGVALAFGNGDVNLYVYALNSPVDFVDPLGLRAWGNRKLIVVDVDWMCLACDAFNDPTTIQDCVMCIASAFSDVNSCSSCAGNLLANAADCVKVSRKCQVCVDDVEGTCSLVVNNPPTCLYDAGCGPKISVPGPRCRPTIPCMKRKWRDAKEGSCK